MSDENILINPDDIEKKRRKRSEKDEKILEKDKIDNKQKFFNRAGTVRINYESNGRFDMPSELFFDDYTIRDVNDITLSRQEEILENMVTILNKLVNQDSNVDVGDMTTEEFLETLVGMKLVFNTPIHVHRWLCGCQNDVNDNDKKVNEENIDLRTLNFVPIEEADEKIKSYYKKIFEQMSGEEFKSHLLLKYQEDPLDDIDSYIVEDELKTITIKEPIIITVKEDKYSFRFSRIKDFIEAQKIARKKYVGQIKRVANKKIHNIPLSELKEIKQEEVDNIKYRQSKDTLLYARALSLVTKNGKNLTNEEKIEIYPSLPRNEMLNLISYTDSINFGIHQEYTFVCPLCGNSEGRWLQQEFNPLELLPLDTSTTGKQRELAPVNIFIG